jgi:hypothetical protein
MSFILDAYKNLRDSLVDTATAVTKPITDVLDVTDVVEETKDTAKEYDPIAFALETLFD